MKHCSNCNRITIGDEPLFCNFCGRSYNVKLCSRLHLNPRHAEVCSQCGSRDLSTPQPRVPLWVNGLLFLVSLLPGVLLVFLSITVVLFFIHELLTNPRVQCVFILLFIALGILWWIWTQLPLWFRKTIYPMLQRK